MAILKDVDINLIDMVEENEDIFGYEDVDFLAEDIKDEGFHGTIDVYEKKNGRYEISAGHRRFLAAKANNMKTIPCSIEKDVDDVTKAKRLIMSNIHQRELSPYNWAKALDYYKNNVLTRENFQGKKTEEMAKRFNKGETTIKRYLRLLNLIPEFLQYTKRMNFQYTLFENISTLSKEEQKEIYLILHEMAENGDISTLSKTLVDQTVNRLLNKKQQIKEKEQQQNIILKSNENIDKSTNSLSSPVLPDIYNNETSYEEMGITPFEEDEWKEFDDKENEDIIEYIDKDTLSSKDGEIEYLIKRIEMLLDGPALIKDKNKIKLLLQDLITKV